MHNVTDLTILDLANHQLSLLLYYSINEFLQESINLISRERNLEKKIVGALWDVF